jgi:hypothetical protein
MILVAECLPIGGTSFDAMDSTCGYNYGYLQSPGSTSLETSCDGSLQFVQITGCRK